MVLAIRRYILYVVSPLNRTFKEEYEESKN